ncbi:sugar transferase [bacterium]|nr:sugar transferase [bacterium]
MRIIVIRGLEIIATGMMMLIFAPLTLCIAIAIFLESGSPLLYKSLRIGKKGRVLSLFYFRTMHPGSGTSENRLTHVGRFLRNYSLDHLPQTLNVLRGEMRMVGP